MPLCVMSSAGGSNHGITAIIRCGNGRAFEGRRGRHGTEALAFSHLLNVHQAVHRQAERHLRVQG